LIADSNGLYALKSSIKYSNTSLNAYKRNTYLHLNYEPTCGILMEHIPERARGLGKIILEKKIKGME